MVGRSRGAALPESSRLHLVRATTPRLTANVMAEDDDEQAAWWTALTVALWIVAAGLVAVVLTMAF